MKFSIPLNLVVAMLIVTASILLPDYIRLVAATMSLYCLPENQIAF
jgi:hypothetical protein